MENIHLCQYQLLILYIYIYKWGGGNTTQNLGSCQKVIPRPNIMIQTTNKIINKQGKSVMFDFFTNCSDLC